jgi:hypothetical protein
VVVPGVHEDANRVPAVHIPLSTTEALDDAIRLTIETSDPDIQVFIVIAESCFRVILSWLPDIRVPLDKSVCRAEPLPNLFVKSAVEIDVFVGPKSLCLDYVIGIRFESWMRAD